MADSAWSAPETLEVEFCRDASCTTAVIQQGEWRCRFPEEAAPLHMYCQLGADPDSRLWVRAEWSWQGKQVQDGERWLLTLKDSSGTQLDSTGGRTVLGHTTSEDCDGERRDCYPVVEFQ